MQIRMLAVCLLGLSVCASADAKRLAQTGREIDALKARVAAFPKDVDARLRLAHLLAWSKQLGEARQHAELIVKQAPKYWDAHFLLARIDGWRARFAAAQKRLQTILPQLPDKLAAHRLMLDIALWSKDQSTSRTQIAWLLQREKTPELYLKLALVETRSHDNIAAYRAAKKALALDPQNEDAKRIARDMRLASFDLAYEFEWYGFAGAGQPGHGTVFTGTILPRNFLSLTIIEEYRYRFESHNHRLSFLLDWRITEKIQLSARGGFALPAKVLPKLTLGTELLFPLGGVGKSAIKGRPAFAVFSATAGYTFDLPPWGGHLHRLRVTVETDLPYGFAVDLSYFVGVLARSCSVDDLHGAMLSGRYQRGPFSLSLRYGFGMELDRPPISGGQIVGGDPGTQYDLAGCPTSGSGGPAPLGELSAHSMGTQLSYRITRHVMVRGAYHLQLRLDPNNTPVHVSHLGANIWF